MNAKKKNWESYFIKIIYINLSNNIGYLKKIAVDLNRAEAPVSPSQCQNGFSQTNTDPNSPGQHSPNRPPENGLTQNNWTSSSTLIYTRSSPSNYGKSKSFILDVFKVIFKICTIFFYLLFFLFSICRVSWCTTGYKFSLHF